MTHPRISDDQRNMAITMLANALRRQVRTRPPDAGADLTRRAGQRGRQDEADAYVRGMVDLLAVLFVGGRPFAEACLAEARRVASGRQPSAEHPELN